MERILKRYQALYQAAQELRVTRRSGSLFKRVEIMMNIFLKDARREERKAKRYAGSRSCQESRSSARDESR
jgi:hypothetical protein